MWKLFARFANLCSASMVGFAAGFAIFNSLTEDVRPKGQPQGESPERPLSGGNSGTA